MSPSPAPAPVLVLTSFFVLLFALSVPFWVLGAFVEGGLPMDLPLSALMFVVPAIAAAIVAGRSDGAPGVAGLTPRTFDPGPPERRTWLLVAALLPAGLAVVCAAAVAVLGLPRAAVEVPLLSAPLLVLAFFVAAALEEAGWTAFATDPMIARFGALGAGLLLGAVWGFWHLVPLLQAEHSAAWIAWWLLGTVAARVVMVGLYLAAGRAGLAPVLFHWMLNASAYNYGADHALAISAIVMAIAAAAVAPRLKAATRA